MRYAIASGILAALVVAAGLAFVVSQRKAGPRQAPGLAGKVEAVIARWTAGGVPLNARVLHLVLGDAASEDILDAEDEPRPAAGSWLSRLFGADGRPAAQASAFLGAFEAEPDAAVLALRGSAGADEPMVVREVAAAVAKAHEAGAEVNLVAQGSAAAPALKAVRSLEGVAGGGVPVGVNKLVTIGADRARLRRLDPAFFAMVMRPINVFEWATITVDRAASPAKSLLGLSSKSSAETLFDVTPLVKAPEPGPGADAAAAEVGRAVLALLKDPGSIEALLKAAGAAPANAEPRVRDFRALDGTMTRRAAGEGQGGGPATGASAPPSQGSLTMIKGGAGVTAAGANDAASPPGDDSYRYYCGNHLVADPKTWRPCPGWTFAGCGECRQECREAIPGRESFTLAHPQCGRRQACYCPAK